MAEPARNFEQPHERTARLHVLGLDEETIRRVVVRGFIARQTCTAFDPPSYPGTVQWAQTHRALRELLTPRGWTPDDSNNYSRVISPDEKVAVTVATGDEHTGKPSFIPPRTKHPKGSETTDAVRVNVQLSLWVEPERQQDTGPRSQLGTWIVLVSTGEHKVRYELSRPAGQDDEGRVVAWSDRIIFDPIDIDSIPTERDDRHDDDEGDDGINVPVERI